MYSTLVMDNNSTSNDLKLATENAIQRVAQKTAECLKKIQDKYDTIDVTKQVNLKKTLLRQLPEKPMRLDIYMDTVRFYLGKYNIQVTAAEYEFLLRKLGLVVDNKVSARYNRKALEIALNLV